MLIIRRAHPGDAAQIARINVDTWRETYKGILPVQYLDRLTYRDREVFFSSLICRRENGIFTYVAENGNGGLAGFAVGGPERTLDPDFSGELYTIYIKKLYQGKGIGTMLTGTVAGELGRAGMHSMLVRVLADNPYRRFYKSLGGVEQETKTMAFEGESRTVVTFGWQNTDSIIKLAGAS